MEQVSLEPFLVNAAEAGQTLAKILRSRLHEYQPTWKQVRALIQSRRVQVGDAIAADDARRLREGEQVTVLPRAKPLPRTARPEGLVIRHLDEHLVVVEKPAGINSVRHPLELGWSQRRRTLDPTLQDLTQWAIARQLGRRHSQLPPLRIVHRLDKETSGLLVFARSPLGERELGRQFRQHTVTRRYLVIIPGFLPSQTITSRLIRDRGDGRRGSTTLPKIGKPATTHIEVIERLGAYTLLACRLETGRTHQIRIHLSEAGHPVCGDKVYCRLPNQTTLVDRSNAPRLALHAVELGFTHPVTGSDLHWEMPLPRDLQTFLESLRVSQVTTGH